MSHLHLTQLSASDNILDVQQQESVFHKLLYIRTVGLEAAIS